MKKNNQLGKIFLTLGVFLIILAVILLGWQDNWFYLRDKITPSPSQPVKTLPKKSHHQKALTNSQRKTIGQLVMKPTHQNIGLKKQGFVAIPEKGILLPIFNDAYSNTGLDWGANFANRTSQDPNGTHLPQMGKSNYGLAAHNFNDGKTGFSALQEHINSDTPYLENGQRRKNNWLDGKPIYLANHTGIYKYTITSQKLVDQTNTTVLNPTKKARVTVVSCLFPSTNFRIITNARLAHHYSWQSAPAKDVNYFNLKKQPTNAHASWYNPGPEEGAN